jgi:hypothetical protein
VAAPRVSAPAAAPALSRPSAAPAPRPASAPPASAATPAAPAAAGERQGRSGAALKDALLAEIRAGKAFLYNTVIAQAQKIEVGEDRILFTFLPMHRALRETLEQAPTRAWLEAAAERLAGRKIAVLVVQAASADVAAPPDAGVAAPAPSAPEEPGQKRDLKKEAMSSSAVQAMLDVFPAEIRDIEEM